MAWSLGLFPTVVGSLVLSSQGFSQATQQRLTCLRKGSRWFPRTEN